MRYQLFLRFPGDTLTDYDAMIALEDQFAVTLDASAEVDGHDMGAGNCNIFVHTDHPAKTFRQVLPILERADALEDLHAVYRPIDGEVYTVLWPENFIGEFRVA